MCVCVHYILEPTSVLRHDLYAIYVQCKMAKRNAILTKNKSTVGVGAGEAVAVAIVVDSHSRSVHPEDTQYQTQKGNADVDNEKEDFARTGKPLTVVKVKPVNTGKAVAEPRCEKRADHTVQVTEDRDGLTNDPSNDPENDTKANPETDGALIALVHQTGLGTETEVEVL